MRQIFSYGILAKKRSLASLLPPSAEGGCTRQQAIGARPLLYRSFHSTYPTGVGASPAAPGYWLSSRNWTETSGCFNIPQPGLERSGSKI
jgi:hypothetical protein